MRRRRRRWARRVGAALCALCGLLAVVVAGFWLTARWRRVQVYVVTEHELRDTVTGSAGDEKGSLVRRRGLTFAADQIYAEVDEVSRVFESRPPTRLMGPGEWALRYRVVPADSPAGGLGGDTLEDPDPKAPGAADFYLRGNDFVEVPYWQPLLAFGLPPVVWLAVRVRAARRSKHRRSAGRCVACGYDLRATPQAGGALLSRCPECGAVGPAPGERPVASPS